MCLKYNFHCETVIILNFFFFYVVVIWLIQLDSVRFTEWKQLVHLSILMETHGVALWSLKCCCKKQKCYNILICSNVCVYVLLL